MSTIEEIEKNWVRTSVLNHECKKAADKYNLHFVERAHEILLSLTPKLDVTEDEVINDLTDKIEIIFRELEKNYRQ